ncbi:MAG: indole-3-glycerol phosphate synthase TrpC [Muribaculaceae bacterium]|nr:indole-3-glycerol phosphate synthase TrpC [Muribaculaceae bacterium]MDE6093153.1 indole-3-glycerol phosphate synthase TrpC [Muribaculaceae bacterium]MDE6344181.1 indole-3-glycerol phosphate synthase TrpC [Muribaculaceae bacterium]
MTDILQRIAQNKRAEINALFHDEEARQTITQQATANKAPATISMSGNLRKTPGGIIAEFKRRSPSKADIFPMADVTEIIPQYAANGAAACSVLTDTRFFGGCNADLAIARTLSQSIPLLRKDFIIDPIQIHEARLLGANAILLIAAILTPDEMASCNSVAHSLGMEALVEIHDSSELDKITFIPDMLGVNNRNLSTFHTDINNSLHLASTLPADTLLVAESGIRTPDDIRRLRDAGFTGFLIGEAFMSSPDPGATLKNFVNETV